MTEADERRQFSSSERGSGRDNELYGPGGNTRSYARYHVGPYLIELWEESTAPGRLSQDASLVRAIGHKVRLAAIDGVTPLPITPSRLGLDGAVFAAQLVRTALQSPEPIEQAARRANEALHDPDLRHVRGQSSATMIAADITEGAVELVRGADCAAFVLRDGRWQALFVGDARRPEVADVWRRWLNENPDVDWLAKQEQQNEIWGRPEAWQSSPVGYFPQPFFEQATLEWPFQALIMTTDGAELNEARCADLEGWLDGLCAHGHRTRETPTAPGHGDLTVLRLTPRRSISLSASLAASAVVELADEDLAAAGDLSRA